MLGKVRAKQYYSDDHTRERNMGILLHGDGSFSGQACPIRAQDCCLGISSSSASGIREVYKGMQLLLLLDLPLSLHLRLITRSWDKIAIGYTGTESAEAAECSVAMI